MLIGEALCVLYQACIKRNLEIIIPVGQWLNTRETVKNGILSLNEFIVCYMEGCLNINKLWSEDKAPGESAHKPHNGWLALALDKTGSD